MRRGARTAPACDRRNECPSRPRSCHDHRCSTPMRFSFRSCRAAAWRFSWRPRLRLGGRFLGNDPVNGFQNFGKSLQKAVGVLSCSYGHTHAAIASRILAAVANENAALLHLRYKIGMTRPNFCEHEICLAYPIWDSMTGELDHEPSTSLNCLVDIALDEGAIRKSSRQARQRDAVHVVRRADFADHLHLRFRAGEHSDPQSRESVRFRECSGYEEVGKTVHGAEHRLATELVIRLIHEYCRLWSDIRQLQKILTRHERSRWIVRAGYGDEPCLRTDSGKHLIDGKLEAIIWICLHRNNSRAGALRVDLVHRECWNNDDHFVLRLEIRFAEQVNGFIDAVREQHLWSRQAQVLRYK